MSQKFQRPSGTYAGQGGLDNRSKYVDDANASPKRAISSTKIDGDFNYLIDAVNTIDDASGARASIAERLDVSLNADGTLKLSVAGALDEWILHQNTGTIARIDNSTITLAGGDFTALYPTNRRVRLTVAGAPLVGDVASCTFVGGLTTLSLVDILTSSGTLGVISVAPTQVAYGPLTSGVQGNAPRRTDGLTFVTGANSFNMANDAGDLAIRRNGSIVARVASGGVSGLAAGAVSLANLAQAVAEALTPAGSLAPYAGASAPAGWMFCNGQTVSRTTYAALFAAIGTQFGVGDGTTTFGIPDLRGRSVFGRDDMGGTAANRVTTAGSGVSGSYLGAVGGNQLLQSHNHTITDPGHSHTYTYGPATFGMGTATQVSINANRDSTPTGTTSTATTGITVNNAGGGGSQNMPPAIILNWMIKV